MLFKLTNTGKGRSTHCGVLEFIADEGKMYVPYWMMGNLMVDEGDMVYVTNVSLPVASFARFQPQSVAFLDISDPKAVLENALRSFACLTVNDIIAINYNDTIYQLKVLEAKPAEAVSIIECDMSVDFAPPVGYQDPSRPSKSTEKQELEDDHIVIPNRVQAPPLFPGEGNRLDGKDKASKAKVGSSEVTSSTTIERGIPCYDYVPGDLVFIRNTKKGIQGDDSKDDFTPFSGEGNVLKPKTRTAC